MQFVDIEPTIENYWRAIILFGRNSASYKFALAKSLIDISLERDEDFIRLEDLAVPYARHLCEHVKTHPKQSTAQSSRFLTACDSFNQGLISHDQLQELTVREGFKYVLDAFHTVNAQAVNRQFFEVLDKSFYIDERKKGKGIRLTDHLFELFHVFDHSAASLNQETEARWRLVETAWDLNVNKRLIHIDYDVVSQELFAHSGLERISITSSRDALNGYQKSRCFYCFKAISLVTHDHKLADVDHFFPHILKPQVVQTNCCQPVNVDGIWNLVLSCKECNRGEGGKFTQIPKPNLLARLSQRNEYLTTSHHPLRETLIKQTGASRQHRSAFLQKAYDFSKERLIHTWQPKPEGFMGL